MRQKRKGVQSMNDPGKKENPEQIETGKGNKIHVSDEELEKVTGGANFWFFDDEKRKPRNNEKPANRSNGG